MLERLTKILIAVSVGIALLPTISFAQANMSTAYNNDLEIETIPSYPRPNEMVSIILSLYTGDLNSADIAWYKNEKVVLSGKGETKYSFRMGNVGEETKIEINIKLLNGASFSKTIDLNPASVDFVWEANSYTPPFYKGKALHPRQGTLKIVAMPEFVKDGKRISPANLVYQWKNKTTAYQSQSGYGKNSIILDGSLLGREEYVEVSVTDPVNNLISANSITIQPVDPEIVFYENDPYYGLIFDKAIAGNFDLKGDEIQILAAPYYFTEEKYGLLNYNWELNGQSIPELSNSRTAIFKKPEQGSGKSVISLNMENLNRILQQADAGLTMNFTN